MQQCSAKESTQLRCAQSMPGPVPPAIPGMPGVHRVFDLLDRAQVSYHRAGENIALNNYSVCYALPQSMQQTNSDLMHSPEHRANLLKRQYTEVGLGLAFEPRTGRVILTEVFLQP